MVDVQLHSMPTETRLRFQSGTACSSHPWIQPTGHRIGMHGLLLSCWTLTKSSVPGRRVAFPLLSLSCSPSRRVSKATLIPAGCCTQRRSLGVRVSSVTTFGVRAVIRNEVLLSSPTCPRCRNALALSRARFRLDSPQRDVPLKPGLSA